MAGEDQKGVTYIPYAIGSNFNELFDEIQNCKVSNRKSDTGFTDAQKLMLQMRAGTILEGNYLGDSTGISDFIFFKGADGNINEYLGYNKKVYKLITNVWTAIHTFTTGTNIKFNIVKLPGGTKTGPFTVPTDATQKETIFRDVTDGTPANNAGKFLYLSNPTGIFQGKWSIVSAYDSTNLWYELGFTGLPVEITASSNYYLFEKTVDYLQVSTGEDNEVYYDGSAIQTLYTGQMTTELRRVQILSSSEYVNNLIIRYNGAYWFAKNNILYASLGLNTVFPNPFYYSIGSDIVELPNTKRNGDVIDMFKFKDRLVIGGTNFVYLMNLNKEIQTISESYGVISGSIIDVDKDVYFLTNNKQLISLSENINGIIFPSNIGESVSNYLKDFNYSICAGFDSDNFYLYGEKYDPTGNQSASGIMLIFNVKYKFWSTYTGLRCSKILSEGQNLYIANNIKGQVVKFSDASILDADGDTTNKIVQKLSNKEDDGGNIFWLKEIGDVYLHFENYTQSLTFDLYMMNTSHNGKKETKLIDLVEISTVTSGSGINSLGSDELGINILGGEGNISEISRARLKKINFEPDAIQTFKWTITGYDGSPFYLNEVKLGVKSSEGSDYFCEQEVI